MRDRPRPEGNEVKKIFISKGVVCALDELLVVVLFHRKRLTVESQLCVSNRSSILYTIYLYMVNLMTLSVTQIIQNQMIRLMNSDFERMRNQSWSTLRYCPDII
jgi:hypothetical protein